MVFDSVIDFFLAHKDTLFLKIFFLFLLKISPILSLYGLPENNVLKNLKLF